MAALANRVKVNHTSEREAIVGSGGDNPSYCVSFSKMQCAFMSSPIFDRTALNHLGAIISRLQWMKRIQQMLPTGKDRGSLGERIIHALGIPPVAFLACMQALPGPVLCSWAHSWASSDEGKTLSTEQSRAVKAQFATIVDLLHQCYTFYAVALLAHPDGTRTREQRRAEHMCQHQRGVYADDAELVGFNAQLERDEQIQA